MRKADNETIFERKIVRKHIDFSYIYSRFVVTEILHSFSIVAFSFNTYFGHSECRLDMDQTIDGLMDIEELEKGALGVKKLAFQTHCSFKYVS